MPRLECGHYLIDLLRVLATVAYNDGIAKTIVMVRIKGMVADLTGLKLCPFELLQL